jgi:hypothetical protein
MVRISEMRQGGRMQLPGPVRAVVGLIATAADEAKHLPDRAIELPMLAVSTALQMSVRAQQRYARLTARGDDVINRRPVTDDAPAWATFDDPVPADEGGATTSEDSDHAMRAASKLLDELLGTDEDGPRPGSAVPTVNGAPPRQGPAKRPSAKKQAAKKQPAKKAPVKKAPVKKAPAEKAAGTGGPAAKDAQESGKRINKPRHTAPSPFDTVD